MFNWFINWCKDESPSARLERTIVQGVISAFIVAIPQIVGAFAIPDWANALAVAVGMAILSPIMGAIGNKGEVVDVKAGGTDD